jgi:CheY-like chemotaxis protein
VLLVEDNPINQKVARWTLEQLGCIVSVASDGQAALSQIETDEVDLIIMDCEMPGMNGYQVTERIRANETDRNSLPIIALTAHATRGARERCLDAGMNDYLAKPFRKADLQRVLERWLPG